MIVVVGLSHKTASIEVRERLALPPEANVALLGELTGHGEIAEALVVSTCNRVEIVAAGVGNDADLERVAQAARDVLVRYAPGIEGHLYAHIGETAVRHLFRVASSLDSLVMGEPQILGQVKSAYESARQAGTVAVQLNRVVSHALRTAKRVRSETTLGEGQVSVPSVAVDLARQIFGDLSGHRALLLGSGQMGQAAAKLLSAAGVHLGVIGRNAERVGELAEQLKAEAYGLDELDARLAEADVVITTTSAPHYVVTREQLAQVNKRRRGRSLFFIDLAVPRDVDPGVGELDGVFLYNIDDLSEIVAETLSSRQREAAAAEEIIEIETRSFGRALSAEQATPTIVSLRQQLSGILEAELERSLRSRLKHLDVEDREALGRMLESAVNKMLHPATRHLRALATDPESQAELDNCVVVLRDLFALQEETASAPNWRVPSSPVASLLVSPLPCAAAAPSVSPAPDEDEVEHTADPDEEQVSRVSAAGALSQRP